MSPGKKNEKDFYMRITITAKMEKTPHFLHGFNRKLEIVEFYN